MQLIGQPIKHGIFGKGLVTDWNDATITINFSAGEKKFIYPDAFSTFLHLKNDVLQRNAPPISLNRNAVSLAHLWWRKIFWAAIAGMESSARIPCIACS